MTFNRQGKHVVDFMFIIALFTVFAASTLFVVIIGAKTYKSTVNSMDANYERRTSVHYVIGKIRQFDAIGGIEIGEIEGQTALICKQEANNSTYLTYLYYYDGALCELTINSRIAPKLQTGQPIIELEDFSVSTAENGLLKLVMTQSNDNSELLYIRPHCAIN